MDEGVEAVKLRVGGGMGSVLRTEAVMAAVAIVGLLLRLWGIGFGLPRLYDPDEWHWVGRALRMLHDHDPNPHWFGHPGTTIMYILCMIYVAEFCAGLAVGSYSSAAEFEALYFRDPTLFYLSGRILIVLFGTATILAVYLLARRLGGRATGLLAATVLALSPVHVLYSRLVRGDIVIGLLLLVSLWFCLNVLEDRRWRDYLAAGFVTGLAVATKYTAAIYIAPILLSHLEVTRWKLHDLRKHTRLLGSGVACLAGAFVGSPFLLLDFQTALSDIAYEAQARHLGGIGEGYLRDLLWYLVGPMPSALSGLGVLLAGLGILSSLSSGRRVDRVVASTPVFFMLFISCHSLRWERWIIPAIPLLCIPLAHAIRLAARWAGQRLARAISPWLSVGLLALVAVPLLRADVAQAQALTGPDTRTLAGEWMLANLPPGSRVLMESGTPQLPKDVFAFFSVSRDGALAPMDPQHEDHALFRAGGSIGRLQDEGLLAEQMIQYVVMSSIYDRYVANSERYPEEVAVYERIAENARLIYELPGHTVESTYPIGGPRLRIYEID
ncbi:MAG: glycosyltransferase family 39 protein [Anaerolineae bacterium]|jgi:hypothetical protein